MGDEVKRRASDTWLALIRRFSRLWGFFLFMVFVLVLFRQVVLPFILASLVAYVLAPIIRSLQPRIGRGGAVIVVYVVLVGLFGVFVGFFLPALLQDVQRLRDTAPELLSQIYQQWLPQVSHWLESTFGGLFLAEAPVAEVTPPEVWATLKDDGRLHIDLSSLHLRVHESPNGGWVIEPANGEEQSSLDETLRELLAATGSSLTAKVGGAIQVAVTSIASFLTKFMLTFMVAAFILIDLERVIRFVRSLVPPEVRGDFDEIVSGMDVGMAGVIRGQLIICLVNGLLTYLGLLLIDVKYSLLLALLAGVFSLVPIFGTILSSVPILLIALVSSDGTFAVGKALAILAWISGIHLVEANFLNPKIIGSAAHIHPVIVVFALLAGESVFGLTGALLAVPVASMIQTIFLFARRNAAEFSRDLRGESLEAQRIEEAAKSRRDSGESV